jgi:formylglycine-generating enzyme required for sulfatase activity
MVEVAAGSFTMGSPPDEAGRVEVIESPQHKVTIARPFAVGKFEVTFAEWEACVAGGGCTGNPWPSDQGWGRGRRPVINVSWHDAKAYVSWLSRKTGKGYRLLSEAEWEYAARAGTTTRFAFGDSIGKSQAQFGAKQTMAVGSFPPNPFGLHDMHGNVWEWVEDAWHNDYQGAPTDGSVWPGADLSKRVLRGGAWLNERLDELRSANRYWNPSDARRSYFGFRIARTL